MDLSDKLTVTDSRTGEPSSSSSTTWRLQRRRAAQARRPQLRPAAARHGDRRSALTYLDGDAGILRYRGYPIEQLAERCAFLEVAYLLARGELPSPASSRRSGEVYEADVERDAIRRFLDSFDTGAHPMAILISGYAALGARHPEAKHVHDAEMRHTLFPLVLAQTAELGAGAIAKHAGAAPGTPAGERYAERFLRACGDALPLCRDEDALGVFSHALDVLFILHADHELNAGTNAMRAIGSAETDPYSSLSGAAAALYGPLHGGANEAVLKMLTAIGDVEHVPAFIERVKAKRGAPLRLRPPRLQELRPAREGDQERRRRGARASQGRARCSRSRPSWSGSPSPTTTSSRASSTRTSTSTAASPTARSASTRPRSPCSSPSRGRSAGSATTTS